MFDIERFLEEKLNPVFRTYYALWVYYWPLWRSFSGRSILRKWEKHKLVQEGQTFLDYGCGTGDFTIPAAQRVSQKGKVYALDYFPRQLEIVTERSAKAGLNNIETILSNSKTGLPDESVDVIWMCDVLHEIKGKTGGIGGAAPGTEERRSPRDTRWDGRESARLHYRSVFIDYQGR